MPTTMKFTSSADRQQTVAIVQSWLNTQTNLSPYKQRVMQLAITHGTKDSFIHFNSLSNLFADRGKYNCIVALLSLPTHPNFVLQSDMELQFFIAQKLKQCPTSSSLVSDLTQATVNLSTMDLPLNAAHSNLIPLYQRISPADLDKKIKAFQQALDTLQQKDIETVGNTLLGSICFFGLSYLINVPFALLALGGVASYTAIYVAPDRIKHREEAVKAQQVHLKALLIIYKSITREGFADTHNPMVLQLLRVIAPYAATNDLWHWSSFSGESTATILDAEPHPEFLQILSQPPHGVIYTRQKLSESTQDMYERLEFKKHVVESRHSFWYQLRAELQHAVYGLQSPSTPSL